MANDPLLQPFRLKHLELRNRILITPHEPSYAEDGMPKDRYRAYHVERAKAGVAMTMTAGSASVSRDSPPAFNNILAYRDEVVGWMKRLVDECHDHGAAVMIQLTHLGRRTRWDQGDWLPTISSTTRREPAHRAVPKLMEGWDRARVIRDYADAAERMKAAGVDGIDLITGGHLIDQIWSPLTNELGEGDGGSLDNRLRFTFDLLRAIRERVGPDYIIGMRNTADERLEGGISKSEGIEIARRLAASGMVDYLNVVRGHIDTDAGLTDLIPVQGMASGPHLDTVGEVRDATRMPTFHAGRVPDLATARHAVSAGKVDMIGMTRAHLADPHLVAKLLRGEEERIRPCVGANYCLDRIYQGGAALCIHNAATGRETEMPHEIAPADTRRKVVVIGAGPGGLEAARVAAERGHEVVVLEAADEVGGQIRLTARTKRRREMLSIVEWRFEECRRLGVTFRFNLFAEAADVTEEAPDVVIVATGGLPRTDVIEGDALAVSSWDILSGDAKPGRDVLVYDEAGDAAGLQAAEAIAETGARVEIMTPDRSFAPEVMAMNLTVSMRELQKRDTRFTVTYRPRALRRDGNMILAEIGSDYGGIAQERRVDQVVVNGGTLPLDELYFELRPHSVNLGEVDHEALIAGRPQALRTNPEGRFQLFRIGDAVSSRNTHAAVYDALRLVKDL